MAYNYNPGSIYVEINTEVFSENQIISIIDLKLYTNIPTEI